MLRKIILFAIISIFIFSFSVLCSEDNSYHSYQWFLKAKYYYNSGKYVESYKNIIKSLNLNPDYKDALELKEKIEQRAIYEQIKLEKEILDIKEAKQKIIDELPKEPVIEEKKVYPWDEFHFNMGKKYYEEYDLESSEHEFKKSLEIYPQNVIAHYYLYRIYRSKKEIDNALDEISIIKDFVAPYILWKKLKETGNYNEINSKIEIIQDYFKYFPDEDFDVIFTEDVQCLKNIYTLEQAYFRFVNLDNMEQFFKNSFPYKVIDELNDYKEESLVFDVKRLFDKGLISEHYKCKNGGEYYFYEGRVYCTVCDKIKTESDDKMFVLQKPQTIEPVDGVEYARYKEAGDNFLSKGNFDRALLNFNLALNYFKQSYDVLNKIGVIYKEKGNIDKAIEFFKKSLNVKFDFIPAFNNLASAYTDNGDYQEAINTLNKALLIKDTDFNLHYNLGLAYEKIERWEDALRSFKVASIINGYEPDPFIHLAIISKNLKDYKSAIYYLRKVKPIIEGDFEMNRLVNQLLDAMIKEDNSK